MSAYSPYACFENLTDAVEIFSPVRDKTDHITDFCVQYVNPAACRLARKPREEQEGALLTVLCPTCKDTGLFDACQQVVETAVPCTKEHMVYHDGDAPGQMKRVFDVSISPMEMGLAAIWRDVTEETLSERHRESQLLQMADLVRDSIEGIVVLDARGIVLFANPAADAILGRPSQGAAGYSLGYPAVGGEPTTITVRRDDGQFAVVEMRAIETLWQGEPAFVVNLHDVTATRKAEAERERLNLAIEQCEEVVIVTDPAGTIEYANPVYEKITGYTVAESIGQNMSMHKSGEHGEALYAELWRTITSGRTWQGRIINRRKDGSLYPMAVSISPVRGRGGNVVNYVAVQRDVSHEQALEEQFHQAQKMESIGRLAGGVAHDFNNVLSVILGYTEMALTSIQSTNAFYDDLQEVHKAGRRAAELTRQLLAFARKQAIAPVVLDLNATIAGMLKMLKRLIGEDIDLQWRPHSEVPAIKIDPGQIDQILVNLAVNARDAIEGVGTLVIATDIAELDKTYCEEHPGFTPGCYVVLTVSDNGKGMDKETEDHIFEPFFTTKAQGKGTGLGLATIYGIVKQNEGYINVYSEPGLGTAFRIYFPPFLESEAVADGAEKRQLEPRGQETILLAEDEAPVLSITSRFLERLGYTVLAANSPEEALKQAQDYPHAIDLLLTDVVMPGMNGRELFESLAALRPEIKCMYMSGYPADVIANRGVLNQNVHFIEKPFTIQQLAPKLRKAIEE